MKTLLRRAADSAFLRHNFIYFSGSIAVSFFNYLYYPVLGRLLVPADFGEVQAVISFFLQAGVFLQVLGLVTIGVLKRYEPGTQRAAIVAEIEQLALLIGLVLFAVGVAASGLLERFLNFSSPVPFLLLALSLLLGIPLAFSNAYLQGHRRFGALAWSNLLGAVSKLILSAGLVVLGWRTAGAIGGVVAAQVITLAYSLSLARRLGRVQPLRRLAWPRLNLVRPELRYAGLVLITSLCTNLLLSLDIIAVKHYFDPHTAGLYAGIATIARIIFFLTGPLAAVLIASVSLSQPLLNHRLLARSALLLAGLGGSALVVFAAAPSLIIRLLIGARYLSYAHLLPRLSLAIFVLSLANLLVYYQVALRRVLIAPASLAGLGLMATLLAVHHDTLLAVVNNVLVGSIALLGLVAVVGMRHHYLGSRHA